MNVKTIVHIIPSRFIWKLFTHLKDIFQERKEILDIFSDVEYNEVSLCSCLECLDIHDFKK